MKISLFAVAALALSCSSLASEPALGTKENPVKSYMPSGEKEYLMRLRCVNGDEPEFERQGSFGKGPHGGIIDGYEVKCPKDGTTTVVFMDMYHRGYREQLPVGGFSVLPDLPALVAEGCPPRVPGFAQGAYVFRPLEVRQGPQPLSDFRAKVQTGKAGRAHAEFVITNEGLVDPTTIKVLYLTDESLKSETIAHISALKFKPAEHRPGCPVPLKVELPVEFE
ncbi:hypothetical protein BH11PSE11_BH11PSE11_11620 [soil metagenome]